MHRKLWADAPFGGIEGGGFADAAWVGDRLMDGNAMTATGVAASVRACLRGGMRWRVRRRRAAQRRRAHRRGWMEGCARPHGSDGPRVPLRRAAARCARRRRGALRRRDVRLEGRYNWSRRS